MKSTVLAAAMTAAIVISAPASAATVSFAGDTTGSPTFNRPAGTSGLSSIGTAVAYDFYTFSVDTAGSYALAAISSFDNYLLLYQGAFDPASSLTNLVAANDDGGGGSNALLTNALLSGTSYTVVVTGFSNSDVGIYGLGISGPGAISVAAVPEPATWALMILGFGAVGGAMRRRQSVKATVRFA
jgi:hypothetical protein